MSIHKWRRKAGLSQQIRKSYPRTSAPSSISSRSEASGDLGSFTGGHCHLGPRGQRKAADGLLRSPSLRSLFAARSWDEHAHLFSNFNDRVLLESDILYLPAAAGNRDILQQLAPALKQLLYDAKCSFEVQVRCGDAG